MNGTWRRPAISGKQKADLKRYFEQAGVPWIYEKPEPEIRISSAYNRKPKGQKHELNYETRLATIRRNLSQQEQRLDKLRQDRYDESTPRGLDKTVLLAMKGLKFEVSGQKRSASQKRADQAAEREEAKELGIAVRRTPAKKARGSSRGGQVNKKLKATFELSGAGIADQEAGKGATLNAAKELNKKPEKEQAG